MIPFVTHVHTHRPLTHTSPRPPVHRRTHIFKTNRQTNHGACSSPLFPYFHYLNFCYLLRCRSSDERLHQTLFVNKCQSGSMHWILCLLPQLLKLRPILLSSFTEGLTIQILRLIDQFLNLIFLVSYHFTFIYTNWPGPRLSQFFSITQFLSMP